MARQSSVTLWLMRWTILLGLWISLGPAPGLAGANVDEGPLSPCMPSNAGVGEIAPEFPWGIEIAGAFSKEEALAEFDRVKQSYADLLGNFEPMIVATCDLHLGTELRYSARIGMATREDADALCAKLQATGGACIVQKN